ncbi:four-carbon acid sugar kinase family protein [Streptococcus caviae]|uniref:four-carbon acid sugar kinase family protein n=1 Tax=Streptococcus sp. 'caviae' TaxID=1915004 RepID=UPI00094B7D63|nr:four-carbon acid sugar kinase family protein [Streptococcus sp. 'caviae']OLN83657.1 hypothetical protein BMI76_05815 [Streptococcus sp. 'caviae']
MLQLLVLADDFTGALDTGVQFSSQGIHTLVTTNQSVDYTSLEDDIEVLVINTESRYLPFEDAYQLVSKILSDAKNYGIPYFYKKVDSALRGNISSEIKALLDQFPEKKAAMVPAYPAIKRVVRGGKLYIDGVPVSDSVFAKDPYEPVTESDIAKRLNQEAGIETSLVSSQSFLKAKQQLLLFDSETESDIEEIAANLHQQDQLSVTIGCAGFAKYLVKQLFPKKEVLRPQLTKPLLVICGSVNPITRQQIEYAQEKQHLRISLNSQELLEEHYWQSDSGQDKLETYLEDISQSDLAIIETLDEKTSRDIVAYAQAQGLDKNAIRFKIGQSLGELTEQLLEKELVRTFLFTGGDTLYQSMQVLQIDQLKPLCELSAGVVLAELTWKDKVIQVITKSGGFGHRELFEDINKMVQKEENHVN